MAVAYLQKDSNQYGAISEFAKKVSCHPRRFIPNDEKGKERSIYPIMRALEYVHNNYMEKVCIEEAAAQCFICAGYFSALFNRIMKCNFASYVNMVRIEKSKELLLDDTLSICDVSSLVGFESHTYFTRIFTHKVGMSPKEYRQINKYSS